MWQSAKVLGVSAELAFWEVLVPLKQDLVCAEDGWFFKL